MTDKVQLQAVLDCKMLPNDAYVDTVGQYLTALAEIMWHEGEGANGKRPFGNSGWESEVLYSLAAAGLVPSTTRTYGEGEDTYTEYELEDDFAAEELVLEALQAAKLVVV